MLYMDNFSLLDTPKTTGQMNYEWLKARYNVYGNPSARIQTFNGRNVLYASGFGSTSVPSWMIAKSVPSAYTRHVCGFRVSVDTQVDGDVPARANTVGLVSAISPTRFGEIFGARFCRAGTSSIVRFNYRSQLGVAAEETFNIAPVDGMLYVDFVFDKISDNNEYSDLIVNINNSPVFYDKAFCNYGTNLEFVLSGLMPYQETAGSTFFAEYEIGDSFARNLQYWMTDFYMTDNGKRFGSPIVASAQITGVTSTLTSDLPLAQVFGGVPTITEFATGTGLSDVQFDLNTGSAAQVGVAVQSNAITPADVTVNGTTQQVLDLKYVTQEITPNDDAQVTI